MKKMTFIGVAAIMIAATFVSLACGKDEPKNNQPLVYVGYIHLADVVSIGCVKNQ